MKRIYLLLFCLGSLSAIAQPNIVRIEYFIDTDPGVGSGTAIPVAAQSINILENVSTATLSEGFHTITFRAEDEIGVWGQYESRPFYVSLSATTSQNNIVAMEYFIDSDPGTGSGTPIAFAPMINLNVLENIPTGALSEGFHLVTVRARDENGVWGLTESKPFFVSQSTTTIVNNIAAMEYFIDADPGRGLGVAIPITPGINLNILENVPTGALSEGFHIITVRAQDENGVWGLSESKPFFVDQSSTIVQNSITAMEYFIDADPGRGLGVPIPITPGVLQSLLENVPTGTLSLGFHILTVRALDEKGNWGLSESKPFYVLPSQAINLVAMEYFIDTDPGVGSGTPIPVTPSPSLNVLENIPTGALSDGFHLFSVRAQDDRAQWGHIESKPFYVNQSSGIITNDIVAMEYYFDSDPGYGSGIPITLTAGTSINILQSINIGGLSSGIHTIHIRAQDSQGVWGLSESKVFFVDEEGRRLIKYEYAIDVDPGIDLATQQTIAPPQLTINETLLIDTNPLTLGPHNLILRVQDENLFWTKTSIVPFTVCDGASANFAADVVCEGNATTFTDLSTNVLLGDIYSWDFESDGIVDDLTLGSTTFTYPGPGPWTASLVIDRAGCKDSLAITVDVGGIPIANAGSDQNICIDNTTLAAAPLLPGESGLWTLVSGTGPITIPTDPNSTITGLSPGINEFNWEVTDPTGTCTANDIVQINFITVSTVPDAGPDQNVCSSTATLAGNIPVVGETGTWSVLSGTGTFADPNDPATDVSLLSSGTNEFVWEIADPTDTCTETDIVSIIFTQATFSDAGADQNICVDNTSLNANTPGVGETAVWLIQSGSGIFTDSMDPLTTVSGLAPGANEFIWEVTDPSGTCFTGDLVVINYIVPLPDAGIDESVCSDNTVLAAGALNVGETGLWTVISGTGIFADTTDPTSSVSGLTPGINDFSWELTDATGTCSSSDNVFITYIVTTLASAGGDQSICSDNTVLGANAPSGGETGSWNVISGSGIFSDATDPVSSVTGLAPGINELQWEIIDGSGSCSTVDLVQVNFIDLATPDAGSDQVLCLDNAQLAGSPLQVGETGQWTFLSGTGTLSDPSDPLSDITSLAVGLNELTWEVTDGTGTCSQSDLVQLNYLPVSIANAGLDQNLCTDNTTLQANVPQGGETAFWSIISGTATLADPTNPATSLTGITSGIVDLQWTITDGTGACSSSDAVQIISNLPISTSPVTVSVSIGDSLIIDVQSLVSINPGDVLTTIITSPAQKGTASVLSNGTIQYKPNVGFFGDDQVTFEICNQCGNCNSNILTINIPNNAPVIAAQDPVEMETDRVTISVNLAVLISDINNNVDLSTLKIIGTTLSGAIATIDSNYDLQIDYGGITFSGTDQVTIEVCDTQGVCVISTLSFLVDISAETPPPIIVYNAVTPNGDGKHDFLKIENISAYPQNEIFIYSKIGQFVFTTTSYNNRTNHFDGTANQGDPGMLPAGTYYYVLNLNGENKASGYFILQR